MTNPRFTAGTVVVCDGCDKPTIPNLSLEDHDGMAWSCTTPTCDDFTGYEIEAEDLVACGCPEWVAERLVALIDGIPQ